MTDPLSEAIRAREIAAKIEEQLAFWPGAAPFVSLSLSLNRGQWLEVIAAIRAREEAETALKAAEGERNRLTLKALHTANKARQAEWCQDGDPEPDLAFRGNELAGEVGEACNVIKKLERERHGWRGSRATLEQLAEELADVVICADLCAVTAGIDLDAAVVAKFNATSEKVGISVKLDARATAAEAEASRLRDEVERLRDALEPLWQRARAPGADAAPGDAPVTVFMSDCRAARVALSPNPEGS